MPRRTTKREAEREENHLQNLRKVSQNKSVPCTGLAVVASNDYRNAGKRVTAEGNYIQEIFHITVFGTLVPNLSNLPHTMSDYISLLRRHYFYRPVTESVVSCDREDAQHYNMRISQVLFAIWYSSAVLRLIYSCHKINVYLYLILSVVSCTTTSAPNTECME